MKAQRPYPQITITPKGEAALVGGHPWVYQVAVLSVDIAEKVLRKSLEDKDAQMGMIDRMLDELLTPNKN